MTQTLNENIAAQLAANGYDYTPAIHLRLAHYLQLLDKWNQVFNLTAVRKIADMVPLHLLDSLAISPYLHGSRIIDVGTGAGLPGIPLALTQPEKTFVLLDSNGKKTRFLTQIKAELALPNVTVAQARVEDFIPDERFDSIGSRAFSSIPVMLAKTQHLAAPDGQFIAMKGTLPQAELTQLAAAFHVLNVHQLTINGLPAQRHVVCIKRL